MVTYALQVQHLTFRYGSHTILENFSLILDPGTILAVIGPNGIGKTTLLKLLAGALPLQSGSVSIAGFDTRQATTEARLRQGYVSDKPFFYERMSGWTHIQLFSRLYRSSKEKALDRCQEIGLMPKTLKQPVSTYSLGMRTKLNWVLATFHHPKVLLLDEPFSSLDVEARIVAAKWITEPSSREQAVILVSHDWDLVARFATQAGRLTQAGLKPVDLRKLSSKLKTDAIQR